MTSADPDTPDTSGTVANPEPPESATVPDQRPPAALIGCLVVVVLAVVVGLWVTVAPERAVDRAGAAVDTVDAASALLPSTTVVRPPTVAPPPTVPPDEVLPISGWGHRMVFSIQRQRVWWVDADDVVLRTSLVSARFDMPDTGVFQVFSKTLDATGFDGSKMDHFVRFTRGPNGGAIGFHDIPEFDGVPVQSDEQLGQPLSHGCIRQREVDATFTWDFLEVGDNVVVVA